jgi:DNA replication protein DnaC
MSLTEKERFEMIRKSRIQANIVHSRVPLHTQATRRLKNITRAETNEDALAAAADFLDGTFLPPLLLLIGTPGVGKTTLSYAVAWEYLEEGLSVRYWQVEELLNELQANLEDGKQFGSIWASLRNCDLLILDDLGAHNPTKWRDSQLDALIDFRYREEAPLLMTANQVDLSDRITDRIKEGRTAMITGKSWRGREPLP